MKSTSDVAHLLAVLVSHRGRLSFVLVASGVKLETGFMMLGFPSCNSTAVMT